MPILIATAPAAWSSFTTAIIENFLPLKRKLQAEDHTFVTETDTEVIAHLIEKY